MYLEWLTALEASGLGAAARSSVWLYPAANLLHVLGAALTLGAIAVLDVLLLRGRGAVAETAAVSAVPLAAFGIGLQIVTGLILLSAEASAAGVNPAFLAKLALIAVGLVNVAVFHLRRHAWTDGAGRLQGAVSLAAWTGVVLAGRAIAYV